MQLSHWIAVPAQQKSYLPTVNMLTNHTLRVGEIQKHSSVEHDYLKDGSGAQDPRSELWKSPG